MNHYKLWFVAMHLAFFLAIWICAKKSDGATGENSMSADLPIIFLVAVLCCIDLVALMVVFIHWLQK